MVCPPTIRQQGFCNDFDERKPVVVCLPELRFGQRELVREQRDIQGMFASAVSEQNILVLKSVIEVNLVKSSGSQQ